MTLIVRTTTKLIAPFLVTYSAYLMLYGHLNPGGGFQAGVILSVSVILLITSHGYDRVKETFHFEELQFIESFTGIFLIILGLIGIIFGGLYYNFIPSGEFGVPASGGTIPLFNAMIGLKVGATFTLLFYILLRWVESD